MHKWYGAQRVLDGVELTVRPGEVTVILGPSGSESIGFTLRRRSRFVVVRTPGGQPEETA